MYNLAIQEDLSKTARTDPLCAKQRMEHIFACGGERVLELCVGPSLRTLSMAGFELGLEVAGNDIDPKWTRYSPGSVWYIGDAIEVAAREQPHYDTAVFAPPLSRGCTGKREDSLMTDEVTPRYENFLKIAYLFKVAVLVLPGRCTQTQQDREQYFKLLARVYETRRTVQILPLRSTRNLQKYVDIYLV